MQHEIEDLIDDLLDQVNQPCDDDDAVARLLDEDPKSGSPTIVRRRVMRYDSPRRVVKRIGRQKSCVAQLGQLPRDGEEILMLLDGAWHGFDLVTAILELAHEATVTHLSIATLGFNQDQTHQLAELLDSGQVARVSMVVSEMFRDKNVIEYANLKAMLHDRGMRVAASRNHAKLMLFEMSNGRLITGHGSLNLRRCHSIEQLALTADPDVYGFFYPYIQETLDASG